MTTWWAAWREKRRRRKVAHLLAEAKAQEKLAEGLLLLARQARWDTERRAALEKAARASAAGARARSLYAYYAEET